LQDNHALPRHTDATRSHSLLKLSGCFGSIEALAS